MIYLYTVFPGTTPLGLSAFYGYRNVTHPSRWFTESIESNFCLPFWTARFVIGGSAAYLGTSGAYLLDPY